MSTLKYQVSPTYRCDQIALKGSPFKDHKDETYPENEVEEMREVIDMDQNLELTEDRREFEVNFDNGTTALYEYISTSQWDGAFQALQANSHEARTWVVRYKEDNSKGVMWRFLPIHSACARDPPYSLIRSLLQAYPEAAGSCDDQGMYPLHYACGNQASTEVIVLLIQAYPQAATICDPSGMLPIHYMAQWGPADVRAIDLLLKANEDFNVKDDEGNTPLHYAEEGDYPLRQEMIAALRERPISIVARKMSLPPAFKKENSSSYLPIKSVPLKIETHEILSPTVSKLDVDDISVGSNALIGDYATHEIMTSPQKTTAIPHSPSANKTVNRLTAQINKFKADFEYNTAEYEEKVMTQREEHENTMEELNLKILKAIDDNGKVRKDIVTKVEYIEYVENRTTEVELDLNHFNDQNDHLANDLARFGEEERMEKSKYDALQVKVRTLASKMNVMIEDQVHIQKSLEEIENDAKAQLEKRKAKLQELYDEEIKYSKELASLKQVYGVEGPVILSALQEQKNMMENCVVVLSECEDKKEIM